MERLFTVIMDIFEKPNFNTYLNCFTEVKEENNEEIYNLRKIKKNNNLYNENYNFVDQKNYFNNIYKKNRFLKKEIYYKIVPRKKFKETYGFVRITNLDKLDVFNWDSLIAKETSPPWFAIDMVVAIYNLGFNFLSKNYCETWKVPKKGLKVRDFHLKMGIADLIEENEDWFVFDVKKKKFSEKFETFQKMNIGCIINQ